MMMEKAGRNDPCPCDSGKKYKKCCLPMHEADERQRAAEQQAKRDQRAAAHSASLFHPQIQWPRSRDRDHRHRVGWAESGDTGSQQQHSAAKASDG
jgi:hypothetical protein